MPAAESLLSLYLRGVLNAQRSIVAQKDEKFFLTVYRAAHLRCDPEEMERLNEIYSLRNELADQGQQQIVVQDYGTGVKGRRSTVAAIHRTSALPHHWGVFLFRFVREWKPRHVLELGTNLGVSACYLRTAMDLNATEGRLLTIEGDPTLAMMARENLARISTGIADVLTGRFQDVLPVALLSLGSVDFVFMDGHHEEEPTCRYVETIKPYLTEDAVIVFDDLYLWRRPLRRAWKRIAANELTAAIDFAKMGLLKFC